MNGSTPGRVVWHDLMTTDPERARAFYASLLGWEFDTSGPGGPDYGVILAGGDGHGGTMEAPPGVPSHWLPYVEVEDADAACARAGAAGGSVVHGPEEIPGVGRFAVVVDPQDAVFAVFAPAGDQAPPAEPVFVWDELLTSDVDAARAFYAAVLGWSVDEMDMGEAGVYTLFSAATGAQVAGAMAQPAGDPSPPHWQTYVGTADVDGSTARAATLGATVHAGPFDVEGVGRIAILGDPTGAVFGFFQPAPR